MRTEARVRAVSLRDLVTVSCGCAALAFCVAYVVSQSFGVALAAAVGIALAPLIAVTPLAAVALLVAVNLTGLVESVPFAATGSLILGVAAIGYSSWTGRLTLRWSPVYTAVLVLVAVDALSVVDARDVELTISALQTELRDLLTFVVIAVLLSTVRDFRRVAWAGVLTAGVLAGITLVHSAVGDQGTLGGLSHVVTGGIDDTALRQTGPLLDPNFWARVLILSAPVALSLAAFERRTRLRLLALAVAVAIGIGVVLTESRGGMIGLGVALVAWLLLAGRRYLLLLLAVPLALNLLLLTPVAGPRLNTIVNPSVGANAPTDYSIAQRELIAQVSTRLIEAHPVLGVGYGNFGKAAAADEARHGQDSGLTAAHNLYLQRAAEGGVVGLLAWLGFIAAVAFAFGRSWSLNRRRRRGAGRRSVEEWLAIGGLAGLVGWSAASVFLHLEQFRSLLVLAAFAAALDIVARADLERTPTSDEPPTPTPSPHRWPRPRPRQLVVALLALVTVAVVVVSVWPPRTSQWEATTTMYITPADTTNANVSGYRYVVLSGDFVQRTFSNVLESDDFVRRAGLAHGLTPEQIDSATVYVSGSSESGQLTVTVDAPDRAVASTLAAAVADTGASSMSSLQQNFTVSAESSAPSVVYDTSWDLANINVAVLLIDLFLVCTILVVRSRTRVRDTALAA